MKVRAAIALAALVAACCAAPESQAATTGSTWNQVVRAFVSGGGTIPPCEFSSATLESVRQSLPPDTLQYGTGFVAAIDQALSSRATGACSGSRQGKATAGAAGGRGAAPLPLHSITAPTDATLPVPLLALAGLTLLLALAAGLVVLVRAGGWEAEWAATGRHAWAEAGYRATDAWRDLVDWMRVGQGSAVAYERAPGTLDDSPRRAVHRRSGAVQRQRKPRPLPSFLGAAVVAIAAVAVVLVTQGSSTRAGKQAQQSFFQDDDHLIYSSTATADRVLGVLARLGVDHVRATIKWSAIAPAALSPVRPSFDAQNPAAYPAAAWAPYDRLVRLARVHGISVLFNVTAPGPRWAMLPAPDARAADHYAPLPREFGMFVAALGVRYSGTYTPPEQSGAASPQTGPLPRVSEWSIWNEPNQPGWLAPQWRTVDGKPIVASARLYRSYVDVAFLALTATGHTRRTDSLLIGELAPAGTHAGGWYTPMTPLEFLRATYCVGESYRPLRGAQASLLGCPASGAPKAFVSQNPGLFQPTGVAHHPYDLFDAPSFVPTDPDVATLSTLSRLTGALDRIFRAYGVDRKLPLYLTEYGYQTNPPDPHQTVSPGQQALYLNQAEYMAWREPRVRSFAQFLLYDALPDSRYPPTSFKYWDTFQTGLLLSNGTPKPAFDAYRLPIWLPTGRLDHSGHVLVWGRIPQTTPDSVRHVEVQWRASAGDFRTVATVGVRGPHGYFSASVPAPGAGELRLRWRPPAGPPVDSRTASLGAG